MMEKDNRAMEWDDEDVRMLREVFLLDMSRRRLAEVLGVCELTIIRWERPAWHPESTRPEPPNRRKLDLLKQELDGMPRLTLPERLDAAAQVDMVARIEAGLEAALASFRLKAAAL